MLSRAVNKLINEGDAGVEKLYKLHIKYFQLVDDWAERLTNGDLLDEYELSSCMERLTGCLMKLGSTAGALEAIKEEREHNETVKGFSQIEKIRTQDTSVVKSQARASVNKIRKWSVDFRNYFYSAQSAIVTTQSRMKRLTVEKGAKRVDRTGEVPVETKSPTADVPENLKNTDTTGDNNGW